MYLDESLNLCSLISIVSFDSAEFTGCPGIEKEGRFQRRKAMGRYRL